MTPEQLVRIATEIMGWPVIEPSKETPIKMPCITGGKILKCGGNGRWNPETNPADCDQLERRIVELGFDLTWFIWRVAGHALYRITVRSGSVQFSPIAMQDRGQSVTAAAWWLTENGKVPG
jgi:hypothetical protein